MFFQMKKLICLFLLSFVSLSLLKASDANPVSIKLVSENSTVRPGDTFWTLIHFSIDPGWHLYWENPGDAGAPPKVTWKLSKGLSAAAPIFPTPAKFVINDALGYGYSNSLSLLVPIHVDNSVPINEKLLLDVEVSYVACKTLCVPGTTVASRLIETGNESHLIEANTSLFTKARNALPRINSEASTTVDDSIVTITIPLQKSLTAIQNIDFYPEKSTPINTNENPIWQLEDEGRVAKAQVTLASSSKALDELHFSGVLVILADGENQPLSFKIDSTIQRKQQPPSKKFDKALTDRLEGMPELVKAREFIEQELQDAKKFMNQEGLWILFLSFLGGMILNVMPCVLPVISLKLVQYIKMRGELWKLQFAHGLAFSFGILLSFWILAGGILLLQAFGKSVGWGFQLQEPLFVSTLVIVIFTLSMSLFGVFEFGTKIASFAAELEESAKVASHSASRLSLWSSFFGGVLATLVAAPCTGPLLGSTLGFTATAEPAFAFLIFTAVGLGMATPYLLLSVFPFLVNLLPKPGPWLVTFKQLMGFFMMGTVLWLLWVLSAETSTLSIPHIFCSFFLMSLGLWIYGTWGSPSRGNFIRSLGKLAALITFISGAYLLTENVYEDRYGKKEEKVSLWEPFNITRINNLRKAEKPVFINFTAKWCLTCQANKIVLDSKVVTEAFAKSGVVLMVADWTNNDEEITNYIHSLGRNGVPVYALYGKQQDEAPQLLPELLTQEIVLDALEGL